MTEKIEWYREVLELEPNSNIFFPLARLLTQDDQTSEAIRVLKAGLDRHPHYLEARLFLIELLYNSGLQDECDAQIDILDKIFASYAGFWQAWAACLKRKSGDSATAIRFIAAQFLLDRPVSFNEALDRGLQAILQEHDKKEAPSTDQREHIDGIHQVSDATPPILEEEIPDVINAGETNKIQPDINIEVEENNTDLDQVVAQEVSNLRIPEHKENFADTLPLDMALPEEEAPDTKLSLVEQMAQPVEAAGYDETIYDNSRPENQLADEESPATQPATIKTRSMAEVLADQGDINGAIEIYRDLLASSLDAREQDEFAQRIDELSKLETKDAPDNPVSKEKLIDILETLAQRVEERVKNPVELL